MIRARYRRIVWFFGRMLFSLIIWDLILPHIGFRGMSRRTRPSRLRRAAKAYRILAVQMGGVMIKVGQFLSARVDVLPIEVTKELSGLQDEVPPVPYELMRQEVERELGGSISDFFVTFEDKPLAAASLGQVHCAAIHLDPDLDLLEQAGESTVDLQEVVVKVQRPNIETIIETDLTAFRRVGRWIENYRPIRKRVNVQGLLDEFTRTLYEELDYLSEGKNAETFARNFKHFPGVRVPLVYWSHTTQHVLTLENVLAIKVTDYEAITRAGVNRAEVASRLLDTYLKQIFEDGFFHADPHPGNLFVHPLGEHPGHGYEGRDWELTFVDFGMTGTIPDRLRMGLRELLISVGTRDAERVVHAYEMMDFLLPNADREQIKRASTRVFDQYWGKNMTELTSISYHEMRNLADEFRDLIYELPFQVPQNMIFLARCVGILSGMCTGLDPEFNLWGHLAPFARKIIAGDGTASLETWLKEIEKLVRSLVAIPMKLDTALNRLERGEIAVHDPEARRHMQALSAATRKLTAAVIFAAFFISGVQLYLGQQPVPAAVLGLISTPFLLYALISSHSEPK
jgi:predicted unusual protein kinase regulating ubiquinone biosynthesis (AarF/ABC1/UbiB family)